MSGDISVTSANQAIMDWTEIIHVDADVSFVGSISPYIFWGKKGDWVLLVGTELVK